MATLSQEDMMALRRQIQSRIPRKEAAALCQTLLELYPSRRNKSFVRRWLKQYETAKSGTYVDLRAMLFAKEIAAHRAKILENRRRKEYLRSIGAPPKAVAVAPDDTGREWFVDRKGNALALVSVTEQTGTPTPSERKPYLAEISE